MLIRFIVWCVLTIASSAEDDASSYAHEAYLAALAEDDAACGQGEQGCFGDASMVSLLQTKAKVIKVTNPERSSNHSVSSHHQTEEVSEEVPEEIQVSLFNQSEQVPVPSQDVPVVQETHPAIARNATAHHQHQQRQSVFFAQPLTHPKRFAFLRLFATSAHVTARNDDSSKATGSEKQSGHIAHMGLWFVAFVASMVVLGMFTRWYTKCLDVRDEHVPNNNCVQSGNDFDEDAQRALEAVRGKPFWAHFCVLCVILLSLAVFMLTLVSTTAINQDIRLEPTRLEMQPDGQMALVRRYPIENGGQRAFEAGQGVVLSVMLACITLFAWRQDTSLKISTSLLAQFSLRGATLSLFIALFLEVLGAWMLGKGGVASKTFMDVGDLCTMLIVGFSEESAKLLAVLLGTCMSVGVSVAYFSNGWTARPWCVLVENPHSLMLAGLAVGFGFMTIENADYVMSAAAEPVASLEGTELDDRAGLVGSVFTMITIAVRVLLNIHPWLAGISAARIARVMNAEGWDARVLPKDFFWALLPSSLIHAAFDFLLTAAPLGVSLVTPPVVWSYARWKFSQEWKMIANGGKKTVSTGEVQVHGHFLDKVYGCL